MLFLRKRLLGRSTYIGCIEKGNALNKQSNDCLVVIDKKVLKICTGNELVVYNKKFSLFFNLNLNLTFCFVFNKNRTKGNDKQNY